MLLESFSIFILIGGVIMKKRKDGRYARQVTIGLKNGKPVKKTIYGKTIKELDQKYRDFMLQLEQGIIQEEKQLTFEELSNMWLTNTKIGNVKEQTITNLKSQLRNVNSHIGHIRIRKLTASHLEMYRASQIQIGKIDQYNKGLTLIRSIIQYAISKQMLTYDITTGMKRISYKGQEKRALTQEELFLLEKANFNDFEYCFVNLLLFTGLRKSEALALNISDLNFKDGYISVSKTLVSSKAKKDILQDNTKTDAGIRKIPILKQLEPILKNYSKNRIGILFESEYGGYLTSSAFFKRWNQIKKKLIEANDGNQIAEDFTPHLFRHTYASTLYKSGMDIKEAQYLLGHSDVKTTLDTYTHFGYVDIKKNKLEEYYETVKKQSDGKIKRLKAL